MRKFLALSVGLLTFGSADAAHATDLCRAPQENAVFSCQVASKKLIAVCIAHRGDGSPDEIVYRFGLPGQVELEFSEQANSGKSAFSYTNRRLGPKELAQNLRIRTDAAEYTIYAHMSVHTKDENYGVLIKTRGGRSRKLSCDMRTVFGELYSLEPLALGTISEDEFVLDP